MKITVTENITLLDALERQFPDSNRTHLKKAIRYGCVLQDNNVLRRPEILLPAGTQIEFKTYHSRETSRRPAPFKILYEDDYMLAVIKPAGILSSGRTTEKIRSMFGMVNHYLQQKSRGRERAYTVHRLDREVSGILLFAKTEEAKYNLQDSWQDVEKHYYALVHDTPKKERATLQSFLKENARQVVYSVPEEEPDSKWAVTHYKVLDYYGWQGGKSTRQEALFTLLDVRLETGRKNQIRVHLSDMGCPIVGDRKYGADPKVNRQVRLYAYSIRFPHPMQERAVKLEMPLPTRFTYVTPQTEY